MTEPSTEYNELVNEYKGLHQDPTMFPGKSVLKYTHYIRSILKDNKCKTLLDYGSGKGYLYDAGPPLFCSSGGRLWPSMAMCGFGHLGCRNRIDTADRIGPSLPLATVHGGRNSWP